VKPATNPGTNPETRAFEEGAAVGLGTWPAGTVFLAAVSGGADSSAMLAALAALREEQGFSLCCLHVEHGLRIAEESQGDALAVRALCKSLAVPCRIVSIAPGRIAETAKRRGLGIEGAARLFRHRAWNREARRVGAARILVAHTRDDLLETVLMRFLRGSGPAGLAAMPRERGRILRPLIGLGRTAALAYLEARGIPFRTDSTNTDIRYLRNRIRHRLIPCLNEFFPYWQKAVLGLAETQRLVADFLTSEAAQVPWEENNGRLCTDWNRFFAAHPLIREEALFHAIDMLTGKKGTSGGRASPDPVPRKALPPRRSTLRLFAHFPGEKALDCGPVRIRRQGSFCTVSPQSLAYEEGFALVIQEPGLYRLGGLCFECTRLPAALPAASPALQTAAEPEARFFARFFAQLPLVLRPCTQTGGLEGKRLSGYTYSIIAEDANGPAALIYVRKNLPKNLQKDDGTFFGTLVIEVKTKLKVETIETGLTKADITPCGNKQAKFAVSVIVSGGIDV
jgi:tRNA(Ile)-lysidine synthase